MTTNEYLQKVQQNPGDLEFSEIMEVIESEYRFTPTAFNNGATENAADQNSGSCKIFSFAQMHGLTKEQTLACFGEYYREDVLQNPDADDHANIRNFMQSGWAGIDFKSTALELKKA